MADLIGFARVSQRRSGLGWDEFLRSHGHLISRKIVEQAEERRDNLRIANTSGDPLVQSESRYGADDRTAALAAFSRMFQLDEDGGTFTWLEDGGGGGTTVFGRVHLEEGGFRLECNSRQRLKRMRRMIEQAAGPAVRHRKDTFESMETVEDVERLAKKHPAKGGPPAPLDPELERRFLHEYSERHYASWPDRALPALGGKTPRQAVKTPKGRAAVIDLLKTFESESARQNKAGRYAYDFSWLRRELGIGEHE